MIDNRIELIAELLHDQIFRDFRDYANLEVYLEDMGIEVYYSSELEGADGYLRINPETKKPRIVVKAGQYSPRQRFTMAHELGHLIWHYKYLPWENGTWEDNINADYSNSVLDIKTYRGAEYTGDEFIKEKEADAFAAAFLMPKPKILELGKAYKEKNGVLTKEKLVELVIDEFEVSRMAAERRIKELTS